MKNNRKHIIAFSIIALVVLMIGIALDLRDDNEYYDQSGYRLVLVEKDAGGWYYEIYDTQGLKIRQEFIPGIPGNIDFETRKSAETTGKLVLAKLQNGKLPIISREELEKNGITN